MRVTLYAVGRLKFGPERDLTARYVNRFRKTGAALGLDFNRIVELPESRASNGATRKREEAAALSRFCFKSRLERAFWRWFSFPDDLGD